MMGTKWVAPRTGATWDALRRAFKGQGVPWIVLYNLDWDTSDDKLRQPTNLELTGELLREDDLKRICSGNVHDHS